MNKVPIINAIRCMASELERKREEREKEEAAEEATVGVVA